MRIDLTERQTGIWEQGAFFRRVVLADARLQAAKTGDVVAVHDCRGTLLQTVEPGEAGTYER